jgi:sterol desaturase/sphingolipid hydroxylase (fatty acid hydroxylase superfamily)
MAVFGIRFSMKKKFTKNGYDKPMNFVNYTKTILQCQKQQHHHHHQQQQEETNSTEMDPAIWDRIFGSYLEL